MRYILTVMLIMTLFSQLAAQSNSDFHLGKGGRIFQGSTVVKPKTVLEIMELNPAAHTAFKKAKNNYDAANVLGAIGGALIGWPLGTALGGGDPQWGMAAGGAALVLLSLPLTSAFKKHANIAIDLYNKDTPTVRHYTPALNVGLRGAGVGMTLRF